MEDKSWVDTLLEIAEEAKNNVKTKSQERSVTDKIDAH
jgi:hypothetical protein